MNPKLLSGTSLVLALLLLLGVNLLAANALPPLRVDLTEHKLYTLSEGTRNILAELDEPVTLRLFLSAEQVSQLPGIASYATRVRELLEEYQRVAGGNLTLAVIDPEPFSEAEDRAVGYGLRGIPLGDAESSFYFGLVVSGPTGEEEVIPFLSPESDRFLEYDVTKLIYQVSHPKLPVVGLISSLPLAGQPANPMMGGGGAQPWVIYEQIQQLFEVRELGTDLEAIPQDIDLLMMAHPKELTPRTLYAIDQYVLGGGNAVVFVDPHAEADLPAGGFPAPGGQSSDLKGLLTAWGLQYDPTKVVGDLQLAETVRFNLQQRPATIRYPVWMSLPTQLINGDDVVTSGLGSVVVATPGALQPVADSGLEVTPLLRTTESATEYDASRFTFMSDPNELLRDYQASGESRVLAARVRGKAKSAFPGGPPPAPEAPAESQEGAAETADQEATASTPAEPPLTEAVDSINVLVFADSDLLEDRFWVQVQNLLGTRLAVPVAANGSLVINALDNLTGSNDLISVRNRGQFSRPFTRVDALRERAELQFRAKERELLTRLEETEQRLSELEAGRQTDGSLLLTSEQQQEIERFRQQKVQIRADLRRVRHELRRDIEGLETRVKLVDVVLVPLLIGVGGLLMALHQTRKRRRARATLTSARA